MNLVSSLTLTIGLLSNQFIKAWTLWALREIRHPKNKLNDQLYTIKNWWVGPTDQISSHPTSFWTSGRTRVTPCELNSWSYKPCKNLNTKMICYEIYNDCVNELHMHHVFRHEYRQWIASDTYQFHQVIDSEGYMHSSIYSSVKTLCFVALMFEIYFIYSFIWTF